MSTEALPHALVRPHRRALVTAALWSAPVVLAAAAAPVASASVSGTVAIVGTPQSSNNTKTYTIAVGETSTQPQTSLAIRFTIITSNATYAATQTAPACWTPAVSTTTSTSDTVTYTYTCTPLPTSIPTTTFTLTRANNPSGSTVRVDLIIDGSVVSSAQATFP